MSAAGVFPGSRLPWAAALLGIFAVCVVFRQEVVAAAAVWRSSTAYGHCWLVLPIVFWLLWERRAVLAAIAPQPAPWAALLAAPLALAWVSSDWLGIMEGRQLALVGFMLVLLLAALGWRLWWALSAAFLYLLFLVPFGAFLTPTLQDFTARFVGDGLRLLDVPFEADSFQITIPEGVFYVAEACAGLRFLIASVAFGVLYAVTMFRSPGRRAAFIAVSCVVPVLANGVRALGIVLLGHTLGSAQAGAADHLVYGWLFFSSVILLLAVAGLPFREPEAEPPPAATRFGGKDSQRSRQAWVACGLAVALAVLAPLLSARRENGGPIVAADAVTAPAGCRADGPDVAGKADFVCAGRHVRVTSAVLAHGSNPARILDTARAAATDGLGGDIDTQVWAPGRANAPPWMLVRARDTGRIAAYAVRVGGVQGVGGLHDRLRMLRDMLGRGTGPPPLAEAVTLADSDPGGEAALKAVLAGLGR